jgi:hypothetical protein
MFAMTAAQTASPKKKTRRWLWPLLLCAAVAVVLFCVDYWAYPYGAVPTGGRENRGENGLWLRYKWYFGEKTADEWRELPHHLKQQQIRSAWFHVRAISKTGRLNFRYPDRARKLTDFLHREIPDVKVMAWVYVGNQRGQGEVNLADTTVRGEMVKEAVWLTTVCGFDGIQWDYEICGDNDPYLLALLRETRAGLPQGKQLSVATPMWLPPPLGRFGWSEAYFAQIAALCDEIAVMCYDSGFLMPRSYVWLVAQQAPHITQAVAKGSPNCRVILGVPTYGQGLFSHNPRAENIRLALHGVRRGLANSKTNLSVFAGVAPFADYTTESHEWETWRTLWLNAKK